jgi:hypothetical protein
MDGGVAAAVAESPSPIDAPHHKKKDPTQAPTPVPKKDLTTIAAPRDDNKDPTQAPTPVRKKDPTPTAAPHHDKKNPTQAPTPVPKKDPTPTAAPHHDKKDPTQVPTPVPKKDPTPAPTTAAKETKRETDDDAVDDDDQVDDTAEEKETDDSIPTDDIVVPEEHRPSGEVTDDVPQEGSSTPQDNNSNLPTMKPSETGQKETDQIETIEDDLVARDDDVLEEELKEEETTAKVFGGFGFLIAIVAMVFTAYQMSENPDGIYASLCRLAITIVSCVIKAVLMPFRSMLGHRGYHAGHMPISTTDPYRSHQLELT